MKKNFNDYLEALFSKKQILTPEIKKDILKDFKEWSGGYKPNETDFYLIEKYLKYAISTKYKSIKKDIETWLDREALK